MSKSAQKILSEIKQSKIDNKKKTFIFLWNMININVNLRLL